MGWTDETLDEEVERLLFKAERLLSEGDADEEELIRFAEAAHAAKAASECHPALCRRFGQDISREEAEKEIAEW